MNEITRFVCIYCHRTNDISPFANYFIQKGKLEVIKKLKKLLMYDSFDLKGDGILLVKYSDLNKLVKKYEKENKDNKK